jgi:diguanylate cyclase (GGDEF)-like protein/PAS domain S-box-containing protein
LFRWGLLAVALLAPAAAWAAGPPLPSRPPGWHTLGVWRQAEGLPQNTVYSIVQTRDGYIWIGTKGGVARFDGVRFTTFDNTNRDQLRENEVWTLLEGDDGSLWMGTFGGGVSRLKDGRFSVLTREDGLADDYVTVLAKDRDGALWVGTDAGVSRFHDGRFTTYTTRDGLPSNSVRAVHGDADGTVWIGTVAGVVRFANGRFEVPHLQGPPLDGEARSFWRDTRGRLWIATYAGLARVENGTVTVYTTQDGLASNRTRQVHGDAAGNLWIVSDRGIDRLVGADQTPSIHHELAAIDVTCVWSDREGSLWVGSGIEGLSRLHQGLFSSYTMADGLADYYVSTILQDRSGRLWVGTRKGLSTVRDGRFVTVEAAQGLGREFVAALTEDRRGRLWVGTETGLYRAAPGGGRFSRVSDDPVAHMLIRVVFEDHDGVIWVGTDRQGLARYDEEKRNFSLYTTEQGLSSNAIRALAQDNAGHLWISTRGGGLNRFKDGRFTSYGVKDGLAGAGIHALHVDADDTLWIGTRQGLNRFQGGRFSTFTARDGLFSDYVYTFVEDGQGRLWMGSAKGVFHVSKKELDDFAARKVPSVTSTAYGLEHGLNCTVGVVSSNPAAFRTSDGRLWFGTNNGLSVVDPTRLTTNTLAPPVPIESVTIDRRAFDPTAPIRAEPGSGDVEIRYAGLSFLAPEKVRFKYRLELYDRDWIDAGTRRVAYYTNLAPGRYRFHVIACNNDGLWNRSGASVELHLAPHLHQRPWFYASCVGVAVAVGWGLLKRRERHVRAHEAELAKRIDERTHALQQEIAERGRAEEALRRSEERYALAVRGANDGVWDWDIEKDRVYFSPRWKAILGHQEDEISDDPKEWLSRVHPDEVERVKGGIAAHCEGKTPHFEDEHRVRHRDGSYRWVLSRGFAVRGPEGRPNRMIGVQTDVTDRRSYDPLTGLPNRALFVERLSRALLRTRRAPSDYLIGVLFLDLDRFKVVNDSLGHLAGDRLLITMGQALPSCVRPADMIARFGGDEFAVLLDNMSDVNDAILVAERVQKKLQGIFDVEGAEVFTSVSIGIATSASGYDSAEDLLRDADTAMYRAKAAGRARYEVFDAAMRAQVMEQLEVESDLRRAVERGDLVLHYQPVVCLRTGRLLGFEALVRWPHPRRGLVYPDAFIGVAEDTGLIAPLGYWSLREACRQMRLWHDEFRWETPPSVSVNMSARQFVDEGLLTRVREILDQTGLEPGFLNLEITESVIMESAGRTAATLAALRALGMRLHLDDFGTGYSSLSYLHQFPVDALKIDRSFVSKLGTGSDSAALIRTILTMARNLEITAVAEGVETLEQLVYLRSLGCDQAQGFYFAEALTPDNAHALLVARGGWTLPETAPGPEDGA